MADAITFEWQNPDQLLAEVRRMLTDRAGHIKQIPARAIRRGAFELLRTIQARAPKKTGTLVRSLHVQIEQLTADLIEGRVGTWLEYARYLEEGTGVYGPAKRPIDIAPKRKRGLFWGAFDGEGRPIVRKRARIQGIKPRGYFAAAIAAFLPRYVQIIEEELARETRA
ncbi:MAG: HK97 gp10 family phage protein [Bryobacteraceae bacterium]